MNNTLTIPKKIKVGYQNRSDTYTKKLAYVIYYDNKGVLRKETSWEGWRDTSINADEFDNIPIEGFILNKGVGGVRQSYSWNARNEYVRVFDPRGFEFEISVANLLFILQECISSRGKGLEGEFVYSWSGKELVLLPVCSKEYSESTNFNVLQTKKITKDAMIPGRTYKFKDNSHCVYLGRHNYYTIDYDYTKYLWYNKSVLSHIFVNINSNEYKVEKGFTNIGEIVNENIAVNYAELLETFLNSEQGSPIVNVKIELEDNKIGNLINDKIHYYQVFYNDSLIDFYVHQNSSTNYNYGKINRTYVEDSYSININYITEHKMLENVYIKNPHLKNPDYDSKGYDSTINKFRREFNCDRYISLKDIEKILELKKPTFYKVLGCGKEILIKNHHHYG